MSTQVADKTAKLLTKNDKSKFGHQRLGHANQSIIENTTSLFPGMFMTWCELKGVSETGPLCKSRRQLGHERTEESNKSTKVLDPVPCDVHGSFPNSFGSRARYFIPHAYDASGLSMVCLLLSKIQIPNALKEMISQMKKMTSD